MQESRKRTVEPVVDDQLNHIREILVRAAQVPQSARDLGFDQFRQFENGQIFDPATTRSVTKGQVDPVTGTVASGDSTSAGTRPARPDNPGEYGRNLRILATLE